jgi:hypothetical protein
MSYIKPQDVLSPKDTIKSVSVLFDGGEYDATDPWRGWSVAEIEEHSGLRRIGVRWNGNQSDADPSIGHPSGMGHATWFFVPRPLESIISAKVMALGEK